MHVRADPGFLRGCLNHSDGSSHMEISTLLIPCLVQGCMCVQGGNNLVNTMELQHFLPCYKVYSKHLGVYKQWTGIVEWWTG